MSVTRARLTVGLTAAAGSVLLAAAPAVASTAVASGTGPATAGPATTGPSTTSAASSWRVALKVTGQQREFTAITAITARNAWAFYSTDTDGAGAYQLSGSAWHKRSFPSGDGEVVSASASAAANVWAFTNTRALRFNGTSWSATTKTFGEVSSGLAVSKSDAWVFATATSSSTSTSAWHYNGTSWTKVGSGAKLFGASALSPSSIWAYGGKDVAHWNGRVWNKTSVAKLLPRNTEISISGLAGIYAASKHSVYALGSGGAETVGGPIVLLHYNGKTWRRIKVAKVQASPRAIVPDGKGGLWIPDDEFLYGGMEHYSHGKLTRVTLPYPKTRLLMMGAVHLPGTTTTLAIGTVSKSATNREPAATVVLRYKG
jgi:hypothetical protein